MDADNTQATTCDERGTRWLGEIDMKLHTNTCTFISEVKKHPLVWNPATPGYGDQLERLKAWKDVLKSSFYPDLDEIPTRDQNELATIAQKKWRNIRTCFTRELLRKKSAKLNGKRHKEYVFFKHLQFLRGATKKGSSDTDETHAGNVMETETPPGSELKSKNKLNLKNTKSHGKRGNEENENLPVRLEVTGTSNNKIEIANCGPEENDGDALFLMSLVPDMKRVPPERRLQLKIDIMRLIAEAQSRDHNLGTAGEHHQHYLVQGDDVIDYYEEITGS